MNVSLSFDFGTPALIEIPFSFNGANYVFVEPNGVVLVECQELLTSGKPTGEIFILLSQRCLYYAKDGGSREKVPEDQVRLLPSRIIMEVGRKIMEVLGINKDTVKSLREQIETATKKLAALESGETMAKN